MCKFVFSALYNESADYFERFIGNFLHYTSDDCALIVNIGRDVTVSLDVDFGNRVRVIRGETQRFAFGATLLAGHMESFRYAERAYPQFEWFTTIVSNSLFFRRFEGNKAVAHAKREQRRSPATKWDTLPDDWHWPKYRGFDAAGERLRSKWGIEGLWRRQHEGRLASRTDWAMVAEVSADLMPYWDGLTAPLEEMLIPTVMNSIGTGKYATICKVKWDTKPDDRFVRLDEMVHPIGIPEWVCMMKWFHREAQALETLVVGTPLGRSILLAMQETSPANLRNPEIECLLRAFLYQLESRRVWAPIPIISNLNQKPFSAILKTFTDTPKFCSLDGGFATETEPFLFLSDTKLPLKITINSPVPSKLSVTCQVEPCQGDPIITNGSLGYLFLPAPTALRLRLTGTAYGLPTTQLVQELIWKEEGYKQFKPLINSIIGDVFLIEYINQNGHTPCFIGLPLYRENLLDIQMFFDDGDSVS